MKYYNLKNVSWIMFLALCISCQKQDDPVEPPHTLKAVATASPKELEVGETVHLNSTSSVNEGNLNYDILWEISSKPTGSSAMINNSTASTTSFAPDVKGDYEVTLTIQNSEKDLSSSDKVTITATQTLSTVLSTDITNDLVLENINPDPEQPDYLVTDFIRVSGKVTVMPGVIVFFEEGAGMDVVETGRIIANGTEAEKIIFTGSSPEPGFWAGFSIRSKHLFSSFKNAEIHFAGSRTFTYLGKAALTPLYTTLTLENVLISHSGQYGIQTRENETAFEMDNVVFENNLSHPMHIMAEQMQYIDETSNFNGGYVEIYEGNIESAGSDVSWAKLNNGKYLFSKDLRISRTVNIAPGAIFEAADNVLIEITDLQYAAIFAKGNAENPVIFTSVKKEPGAWRGILQRSSNAKNLMEYVTIENGGSSNQLNNHIGAANLGVMGSVTLNNVHIANSTGYGIIVHPSSHYTKLTSTEVTFENNALGDLKDD